MTAPDAEGAAACDCAQAVEDERDNDCPAHGRHDDQVAALWRIEGSHR